MPGRNQEGRSGNHSEEHCCGGRRLSVGARRRDGLRVSGELELVLGPIEA